MAVVAEGAGAHINGFTTAPSRPVRLPSQPLLLLPPLLLLILLMPFSKRAVGVDGCTSSRSPLTRPLGRPVVVLMRGLPPYGL